MFRKFAPALVAVVVVALAACGGHAGPAGAPGMTTYALPALGPDLAVYAAMPKDTIGEEYYKEGIGAIKSAKWDATLSSYTQQHYSQSLGFPPNTEITVVNLSKTVTHTLNVVKEVAGPPAVFPKGITLSTQPKGGGTLQTGYASGPIKPGKSIKVMLGKPGIYLIGCAFHYGIGMHDVIIVAAHAAPGPQATPTPKGTGSGSSGSGW